MEIIKDGSILLQSAKLPTDRLWTFPKSVHANTSIYQDSHVAASVIRNDLQAAHVKFWSAALGSPADGTLIRALSAGYLGNLPKLTARMVRRHLPNSMATAKGHLDRQRQGVRSTKRKSKRAVVIENIEDPDADWDSSLYTWVVDRTETENHSDLTGKFPVTSLHGNNYILMYTKITSALCQ